MAHFIKDLDTITIKDIPSVGGKTASLGEMTRELSPEGINIPPGFAITADAYDEIIFHGQLAEKIDQLLSSLDTKDVAALSQAGRSIRSMIKEVKFPEALEHEIRAAYQKLNELTGTKDCDIAVRSSATAEDLPDASFAGQQETFLNIRGEDNLLRACSQCFASLFTDRAISYRVNKGFKHSDVKLSICIQQMIRSDLASSGVIFTLEPESGATNVILITSAYGLGENIVGGKVDPDEFLVQKDLIGRSRLPIIRRKIGAKQMRLSYDSSGTQTTKNIDVLEVERTRPSLSDQEILQLAKWSRIIENHYSSLHKKYMPMDIEWAKDGRSGKLFILQARPETVHGSHKSSFSESYRLLQRSRILLKGRAVGSKIGTGRVKIINNVGELTKFQPGEVLVTDMTDPDWEPVMKKAGAIITNRGGRTCHAAIISREHGVPCLVGTGTATETLKDNQEVTISCAQGDEGYVFEGILKFSKENIKYTDLQKTKTKVMVNLGNPNEAFQTSMLPVSGVGLARMEFIINDIKIHPMALINLEKLDDLETKNAILKTIGNYADRPTRYFVDKLAEGVAIIAGAFYPRPVIVRFSDFKTNEYAHLLGGKSFEPQEDNPMIGFRGASRYYHQNYREGFALECQAIKLVREEMGLTNVKVMVPFCRTPQEGKEVLNEMAANNLIRGKDGLEVYVMAELPSNVLSAAQFAEHFDGFSIGSNDLTQMILGVDRDSEILEGIFDERDPAVLKMLAMVIKEAKIANIPIGICGQAPSDYPEITKFLVNRGIDSISVTSDVALKTLKIVSDAESKNLMARDEYNTSELI
ncbi:MAG: phosphoenolpyruvate synthase [Bacteriovoracaceae bacterium]|nr:phosphoenolpyruvate synthase [Bacteriovoracaceae bacterium]